MRYHSEGIYYLCASLRVVKADTRRTMSFSTRIQHIFTSEHGADLGPYFSLIEVCIREETTCNLGYYFLFKSENPNS